MDAAPLKLLPSALLKINAKRCWKRFIWRARVSGAGPRLYAELYALISTCRPCCCQQLFSHGGVPVPHWGNFFATDRHEWEIDFDIFVYLRDHLTNWFTGYKRLFHIGTHATRLRRIIREWQSLRGSASVQQQRSMLLWKSRANLIKLFWSASPWRAPHWRSQNPEMRMRNWLTNKWTDYSLCGSYSQSNERLNEWRSGGSA